MNTHNSSMQPAAAIAAALQLGYRLTVLTFALACALPFARAQSSTERDETLFGVRQGDAASPSKTTPSPSRNVNRQGANKLADDFFGKWRNGNEVFEIIKEADGSPMAVWPDGQRRVSLELVVSREGEVARAVRFKEGWGWATRLSEDGKTMVEFEGAPGKVWKKEGDAPVRHQSSTSQVVAPTPTEQQAARTSGTPAKNPLQEEFEEAKRQHFAEIVYALKSQNQSDIVRLEALRKRVGVNDIAFVKRMDEAIEVVRKGGSLNIPSISSSATYYERDFLTIADSRSKEIRRISFNVLTKNKRKFLALQDRAFNAKDYDLVTAIKAFHEGTPSGSSSGSYTSSPAASSFSVRAFTITDLKLEMLPVRSGTFQMGSNRGEPHERPVHKVTITKPFWLGKYPVTQAQYQKLMGYNPSEFKQSGPNAPVERVSWDDAMSFCIKLTERERAAKRLPAGYEYTLPTEAQWEYACRAGTTGEVYSTAKIDSLTWHSGNSGRKTQPVGKKTPNAWGFYDMYGNVWEWCLDIDFGGYYSKSPENDPLNTEDGGWRVKRGASWWHGESSHRSAFRQGEPPSGRNGDFGFRLALSPVR